MAVKVFDSDLAAAVAKCPGKISVRPLAPFGLRTDGRPARSGPTRLSA